MLYNSLWNSLYVEEGLGMRILPLSVPLLKTILLKGEPLSPESLLLFGIGDNQMVPLSRCLQVPSFCILKRKDFSNSLQEKGVEIMVARGIKDRFLFLSISRIPSFVPSLPSLPLRLRWCDSVPLRPSTKVLSRPIIILAIVRQWVNTSSISSFIRTVPLPVLAGDRLHGRLPAVIISSAGKKRRERKTSILLPRTPVSSSSPGLKFPILPLTSLGGWQRYSLRTGRGFTTTQLFCLRASLIPPGLKESVIGRPIGSIAVLLRVEVNGIPIIGLLFLLKQYSYILWFKTLRSFLLIMTKKEAQSGEGPTIEKLIKLDREVKRSKKIIKTLKKIIKTLKKMVKELKNMVKFDSSQPDPSTPSAMKPPYEKPSSKGRSKGPGRKKGHQGTRRPKPERIDDVKPHTLSHCPDCLSSLGEPLSTRERFTEDIPKVKPVITKHIINIYWCRRCKKNVEAKVEDTLPKNTLGNRLLAQTTYLHFYLGLSLHKIVTYLNSCLYFPVSPGGLSLAWTRISEILSPWYESLGRLAKDSTLLHIDETGWRVSGKTYWLWCFANDKIVYYLISPSRASPVIRKVLGEFFKGILVCDFFGAYNRISALFKQRCLLHLLTDIKRTSVFCKTAEWLSFSKDLKRLIKEAIRLSIKGASITPEIYARRCDNIHKRLKKFIQKPYQDKQCLRLIKRLKRHQEELFTFLEQKDVPFHNNHVERMIRPPVVARKNSYCNRSQKGAKTQAILMSIFYTLHLRGQDPIAVLEETLRTYCKTGSLPSLSEMSEAQLARAS